MRKHVEVRGPASAAAMWSAYADTSRWSTWAPQIRRVHPLGPLEVGMRGVLDGPFAVRARFEVTRVDEVARRWSWRVHVGPACLTIDHAVMDGRTSVDIEGPGLLVQAYAPLARLSLPRLAHVT
jgi:hypothetical protein